MTVELYHDSHQSIYRSTFGAMATGAEVTLRLKALGGAVKKVSLRLWNSRTGESLFPMTREENRDFYTVNITMPEEGCLLWYFFIVETTEGTFYYGNNVEKLGGVGAMYTAEPPAYQITVYEKGSVTPSWFKEAVVYQIFPDRFFRGGKSFEQFMGKEAAVLHSCWGDRPYYIKDAEGNVVQYDFFGGNLKGIREKLPYLKELGINTIYLNPIFEARSNHRYDTSDYKKIDSFLGTEEEFKELCTEARKLGIRFILDGVFSHTGDDSIYFNKYGSYDTLGAYESKESPYYSWYKFEEFPDKYKSWWGVDVLPEVNETAPSYMDYIIRDKDSVLKHWLKAGASGWRLDVADELPEEFLKDFWKALKETNPEALLIGEVWEDASNKVSYGQQRTYLSGGQLDSAMNYVLRKIMLDFVMGKVGAERTSALYLNQMEHYPLENFYAMLNLLGSHDRERVLSLLENSLGERAAGGSDEAKNAEETRKKIAEQQLKLLWTWLFTIPGAPCVYYGDEVGLEGGKDPDNRRTYPWGKENLQLKVCCQKLIRLRRENTALSTGRYVPLYSEEGVLVYCRSIEGSKDVFGKEATNGRYFVAINTNLHETKTVTIYTNDLAQSELKPVVETSDYISSEGENVKEGIGKVNVPVINSHFTITLPPVSSMVLEEVEPKLPRRSGVLLHPTSLPFVKEIGIGKSAVQFLTLLQKSKQKLWQFLPLNPPDKHNSPYLSLSAFAGDPRLFGERAEQRVKEDELAQFRKNNQYWLEDYALFRALKDEYNNEPWYNWPKGLKERDPKELAAMKKKLAKELRRYEEGQYHFFTEWGKIKAEAAKNGISLLGDLPIFVAWDSADCWAHQDLFLLDEEGNPKLVAGVPPDYFSKEGQLWGNPLYNWEAMDEDKYEWWVERFKTLHHLADEIRIDHFRGFVACWAVDAGAETAIEGKWLPGPGSKLFNEVLKALPTLRLVAEDLGVITDDVCALKEELKLPGMKILQFHLKERGPAGLDLDTGANTIVYTGTHDNNTLLGWWQELGAEEQQPILEMLKLDANADALTIVHSLIEYVYSRNAATAIIPLQDFLALDSAARMNTPGTTTGNWEWKVTEKQLASLDYVWLGKLAEEYRLRY